MRLSTLSVLALCAGTALSSPAMAADLGSKGKKAVQVVTPAAAEPMGPDDSYGFLDSSNAGKAGDKSLALENTFRWGKTDGRYFGMNSKLEFAYTPVDRLQLAIAVWGGHHNIAAVSMFAPVERNRFIFDGLSTGLKYQFAERGQGLLGFGFSGAVSYRWSRISEGSGLDAERHALGFTLAADRTLIEDRMFMALNFGFGPGTERTVGGSWTKDSGFELGGALSYKVLDNVFIGFNARYAAAYEGAWFGKNVGQAIFVGPSMNISLPDGWAIVAAWTPQVWGRDASNASPSGKDFTSFERHQARLKISKTF